MKTLSPELSSALSEEVTTLCNCWKVTRKDGVVLGFTDHDQVLVIDGLAYEAATGLTGTEAVAEAGLAAGGMEVSGVLSSTRIEEGDLLGRLFDGASVDTYLVNWREPDQNVHLRRSIIGEIVTTPGAFRAEVRSLSSLLNHARGRIFARHCDAEVGDTRCGLSLSGADFERTGTVTATTSSRSFMVSGLHDRPLGWFSLGQLTWLTGNNVGASQTVIHVSGGTESQIDLRQPVAHQPQIGDTFRITAGCDKTISTCRDKFANTLNFRGFPHMPGNDFVLSYPDRNSGRHDGSALQT